MKTAVPCGLLLLEKALCNLKAKRKFFMVRVVLLVCCLVAVSLVESVKFSLGRNENVCLRYYIDLFLVFLPTLSKHQLPNLHSESVLKGELIVGEFEVSSSGKHYIF